MLIVDKDLLPLFGSNALKILRFTSISKHVFVNRASNGEITDEYLTVFHDIFEILPGLLLVYLRICGNEGGDFLGV